MATVVKKSNLSVGL